MPIVINATEENVTVQVAGNYFSFKPGQRRIIRSNEIALFIQTERRGSGLAVLPDLTTLDEDNGDVEVTPEQLEGRKAELASAEKIALQHALDGYIAHKRELIRNNQVSLAKDLARADYKYSPDVDISDGELDAMRLVAKYGKKDKDTAQDRLNEVEKLKKQIAIK